MKINWVFAKSPIADLAKDAPTGECTITKSNMVVMFPISPHVTIVKQVAAITQNREPRLKKEYCRQCSAISP